MAILDTHGRPLERAALKAPQTAPLLRLQQSFAGHPVRGLTPERMASMLTAAESGDLAAQADLFQDMEERDPHLHAEMAKRRRAMLGLTWSIEPPPAPSAKEKRQAKGVAELLTALPDFEDTLLDALDAIGHGFACLEIRWAQIGGAWLPEEIAHRPQNWFRLDKDTRQELHLNDGSSDGVPLWPFGWIVHRHAARSGYLTRAGLYRVLAWPWIMRQFSLRDMAEWLEIYGLPLRIGKYPVGAQPDDKAVLARAVRDLGRNAAGIMPEDMAVELVAAATGAADPFMAMVAYCDSAMSKAILGGTLSSTPGATGMGSGVANLQGEVRRDLLVSDARQLQGTLSRDLVWPIAALNGLGDDPRRAPRLTFDTREAADLTAFSQSIERLVKAGLGPHIPVAWVREQTGIPEPAEGDTVLALPAPAAAAAAPGGDGGSADAGSGSAALGATGGVRLAADPGAGRPGSFSPGQQRVEALVAATLARASSPIPIARLRAVIAAATDPQDLEARLAKLYGETVPGAAAFRELTERALFTADVLGYRNAEVGED